MAFLRTFSPLMRPESPGQAVKTTTSYLGMDVFRCEPPHEPSLSDLGPSCSEQDSLRDALETMLALEEATRSIDALYEEVLGSNTCMDELGIGDSEAGYGEMSELDLRILEAIHRCNEQRDESVEVSEQSAILFAMGANEQATAATSRGSQVVDLVAEAGWSVAEGFLSMAADAFERATNPKTEGLETVAPCVEGLIRVDGDLAMDAEMLRETLRVLLCSLLQPLAQLRSVTLNLPPEHSVSVVNAAGAGPTSGCSFVYRICVADRHDLEPLRETLLLEAESGGARSLLPLLTDQLCQEGYDLPRHLKVRLEVLNCLQN